MEHPINQSVITLVTKGRHIKSVVKSQPLFDVHRHYLQTFLIDLQVEVSRFRCRIFHWFACFSKLVRLSSGLSFVYYSLVTVMHLEAFENNLFELDFSISKNTCFHGQTFSGRGIFCTVMKYFFRDSCSFPHIKTFLKVSDPVFEKNPN